MKKKICVALALLVCLSFAPCALAESTPEEDSWSYLHDILAESMAEYRAATYEFPFDQLKAALNAMAAPLDFLMYENTGTVWGENEHVSTRIKQYYEMIYGEDIGLYATVQLFTAMGTYPYNAFDETWATMIKLAEGVGDDLLSLLSDPYVWIEAEQKQMGESATEITLDGAWPQDAFFSGRIPAYDAVFDEILLATEGVSDGYADASEYCLSRDEPDINRPLEYIQTLEAAGCTTLKNSIEVVDDEFSAGEYLGEFRDVDGLIQVYIYYCWSANSLYMADYDLSIYLTNWAQRDLTSESE